MDSEIQSFLDREGRLTLLPAKRRKKIMTLCYLAGHIPEGVSYTEREFNQLLQRLHTFGDPATLRRELYDLFLINRTADGKAYCLNPDRPTEEELLKILL